MASSRAMVRAAALWAARSPSQTPGVGGSPGVAAGIGRLTGFGGLHGFGTRCWAICLPMTTSAIPTSSLVPWIVALRAAPDSFGGPDTAMRAFEMVVANLRLRPTWPMRWPTTDSGTHNVQSMCCRSPSVCRGGGAVPSVGSGGLAAPPLGRVLLRRWRVAGTPFGEWIGCGHSGLCGGVCSAIRGHGHQWRVAVSHTD
jgi:hypothetical protein